MKLTNEELKNLSKNIGSMPFINMTKENKKVLKSIINELIELREKNKE